MTQSYSLTVYGDDAEAVRAEMKVLQGRLSKQRGKWVRMSEVVKIAIHQAARRSSREEHEQEAAE